MKKRTGKQEQERLRLLRLFEQQSVDEVRLTPGYLTHNQLWNITTKLPEDYEPYGKQDRRDFGDCSCGCRWYHLLAGRAGEDWGVCGNPASHRAGLLTFGHQGCPSFKEMIGMTTSILGTVSVSVIASMRVSKRLGSSDDASFSQCPDAE